MHPKRCVHHKNIKTLLYNYFIICDQNVDLLFVWYDFKKLLLIRRAFKLHLRINIGNDKPHDKLEWTFFINKVIVVT